MNQDTKFIYFDLDDTLLDHKHAERQGLKDLHSHFGWGGRVGEQELSDAYHRINSRQWQLYSRREITRDQLQRNRFELTLKELGLDHSRYEEAGDFYMQRYRHYWSWVKGAQEAFDAIRNSYSVGILTNGFSETQKLKFDTFGLHDAAEHLVISEEVGFLKPHPAIFRHATDLAGCRPQEILYVGDSLSSDVIGGSDFGWNVAWYDTGNSGEGHEKAVLSFHDFSDLRSYLKLTPGNPGSGS